MRKAHIKIDEIVSKCEDCPFMVRIVHTYYPPREKPKKEIRYYCNAFETPSPIYIGFSLSSSIPDWCPFLEKEADDE